MSKLKVLILKSQIKAHTRTLKSGRVVNVRDYSDKRTKKLDLKTSKSSSVAKDARTIEIESNIYPTKKVLWNTKIANYWRKRTATFHEYPVVNVEGRNVFMVGAVNLKNTTGSKKYTLASISSLDGAVMSIGSSISGANVVAIWKEINELADAQLQDKKKKNHINKAMTLKELLKSQVKAHTKTMKSGKVVPVRAHTDKRTKSNAIGEDKGYGTYSHIGTHEVRDGQRVSIRPLPPTTRHFQFASYEDALEHSEERQKHYKSKIEYQQSEEYRELYPQIKALYEKERKKGHDELAATAPAAMREAGVKYGDTVSSVSGPFFAPIERVGVLVNRNGLPYVKFAGDKSRGIRSSSTRWHKGYTKVSKKR